MIGFATHSRDALEKAGPLPMMNVVDGKHAVQIESVETSEAKMCALNPFGSKSSAS